MLDRLLDIRPGEGRTLLLLGVHFFLLLAATTLLGTASDAIFLTVHPYNWVPLADIAGAVASILAALAYGRWSLGRRARVVSKTAMSVLAGLLVALCLLVWAWPHVGAFAFAGLAPVFGVAVGMESAGLITRALDTRQARRLYPAISGIGGIGATCGALMATVLSSVLGQLLAAAAAGIFLLAALVPALRVPEGTAAARAAKRRVRPVPWREMFQNRFSLWLVVLVSLAGVLSTTAKFVLKASVQEGLPKDQVMPYLGGLNAALNAASIVFSFFITRRVVARLGLGAALMIYPLLLALVGGGGLMVPGLAMGAAALFSERLFRQNLQKPLLHIATNPLPPGLAARTNVAVRGAVETPAVVLTSLTLLVLGSVLPWHIAFWILLGTGILGACAAFGVRRHYGHELVSALRSRRLQTASRHDAPQVLDAAARRLLHTRLESETPERAALAAQLLSGHADRETLRRVEQCWSRWPPWVRAAAINMLAAAPPPGTVRFLTSLSDAESPDVQVARLRAREWVVPSDRLAAWLGGDDAHVAAATAIRALEDDTLADRVESAIDGWLASEDATWRHAAITVLAARSAPRDAARIVAHASEAPREILVAAARRPMPALAPFCTASLADEALEPLARAALLRMGESAVGPLASAVGEATTRAAALAVLVRVETPAARVPLFDALEAADEDVSVDAARALWREGLTLGLVEQTRLRAVLERACATCERLAAARSADDERVAREAARRLERAFEWFFLLLSVEQPERAYRRLQLSLFSEDARERSFAVEGLDELLEAPWRSRIVPLLDRGASVDTAVAAAAVEADADLRRIAQVLTSEAPSVRLALALEATLPFRGMAFSTLERVADDVLAAEASTAEAAPAFSLRAGVVEGLDVALRGESSTGGTAGDAIRVPLASVWPTLGARPEAARQWLRNLAAAWVALPPDGADVSHSGVSIASEQPSDETEGMADLSVWQRVFYLRLIPLFAALPATRLRLLAEICSLHRVRPGQRVIHAKRPAGHGYVICRGVFDVLVGGRLVDELGEAEAFGLLALLSGRSHPGTVVARQEGEVLAIDRVDFHDLLATHPGFVRSLSRWTAHRAVAVAGS